jgi:hypothetical protein
MAIKASHDQPSQIDWKERGRISLRILTQVTIIAGLAAASFFTLGASYAAICPCLSTFMPEVGSALIVCAGTSLIRDYPRLKIYDFLGRAIMISAAITGWCVLAGAAITYLPVC